MYLLTDHRWTFYAVPKCASNTMYAWLQQHFKGERRGGHHKFGPHEPGYRRFCIVREAVEFAKSTWTSTVLRPKVNGIRRGARGFGKWKDRHEKWPTFEAFTLALVGDNPPCRNLAWYLRVIEPDFVARLESLDDDLLRLPFVERHMLEHGGLPRLNTTDALSDFPVTDEQAARIRAWDGRGAGGDEWRWMR